MISIIGGKIGLLFFLQVQRLLQFCQIANFFHGAIYKIITLTRH
jgi:hypothetical protein